MVWEAEEEEKVVTVWELAISIRLKASHQEFSCSLLSGLHSHVD